MAGVRCPTRSATTYDSSDSKNTALATMFSTSREYSWLKRRSLYTHTQKHTRRKRKSEVNIVGGTTKTSIWISSIHLMQYMKYKVLPCAQTQTHMYSVTYTRVHWWSLLNTFIVIYNRVSNAVCKFKNLH